MAPQTPQLSLVICTLDESDSIGSVLAQTQAALASLSYEILVVDDSDDERTVNAVRAQADGDPRIRVIHRPGERGLAAAAICGFDHARGDVLGVMDGDGQHEDSLLPALFAKIEETGVDVAVASRYVAGAHTGLAGYRHQLSAWGTRLIHLALGVTVNDPLAGFFLMRRNWYEAARPRLSGVGFKILVDVLVSGPRKPMVAEIGTALRARIGGESKLDMRVVLELAAQIIEQRTGGAISAKFALFAGVGATGIGIHLLTLSAVKAAQPSFMLAQATAIMVAMTWNFWLNNCLTFRDRRLQGAALLRSLFAFYAACAVGAVASEAVATGLFRAGLPWLIAGGAGSTAASLWNYWAAAGLAWKRPSKTMSVQAADDVKIAL